jgi:hypothetical protein
VLRVITWSSRNNCQRGSFGIAWFGVREPGSVSARIGPIETAETATETAVINKSFFIVLSLQDLESW